MKTRGLAGFSARVHAKFEFARPKVIWALCEAYLRIMRASFKSQGGIRCSAAWKCKKPEIRTCRNRNFL